MEDAIQLLTGHLALVGLALLLVGFWIAWPRLAGSSPVSNPLTFAHTQRAVGLILAIIGLVLVVMGMVSHPLY